MTSVALLRAFVVETIERKRSFSQRLGYSQLNYGRLFIRDQWTLFAIARELGCTVDELIAPVEPQAESRVTWSEITVASEGIMEAARSLRDPIKQIVLLKAAGFGIRKIGKALPGRTSFSIADDLAEGTRKIWILAMREIRFLAFADHPKFIVVKSRSLC